MPDELSESEIFALLARRRRRLVLQIVQESSPPLTTTELATRIADREYEDPSAEDLERVRVALYHTHLAKLDAAGVVTYDEDEGTVYPGLHFDALVCVLESTGREDLPWSDE